MLYFFISGVLLFTNQKLLTIITIGLLALFNLMRFIVWWNNGRNTGKCCLVLLKAFLSMLVCAELILISVRFDQHTSLKLTGLCALMWVMLPFFVLPGFLVTCALVFQMASACRKNVRPKDRLELPFFFWLFLNFVGWPILTYLVVSDIQSNSGMEFNYTDTIESCSLAAGCYGIAMFLYHLAIFRSFK